MLARMRFLLGQAMCKMTTMLSYHSPYLSSLRLWGQIEGTTVQFGGLLWAIERLYLRGGDRSQETYQNQWKI